jgi:dihydrofolate synthase/folylpolyglutamate synthase
MALECLRERFPVSGQAIRAGVAGASLPGRFQWLPGPVPRILDVAHNPAAARQLAAQLAGVVAGGCTHAVVAMLADKDICGTLEPLAPLVCSWHVAGLDVPRGADAARLAACLETTASVGRLHCYRDVAAAQAGALTAAAAGDRVLVFGSFHTVAEALSARL